MSKGTLGQVVKRAISDAAFRRQLQADPSGALKGFDLSDEERSALRSGDASKLSALGIDQRMSKAFTLGDATASASKSVSTNDLTAEASISDARMFGGARSVDDARLVTNPKSADSALISDGNAGTRTGATESGGGAYRSPIRDADNTGGAQTAREFDAAAGNTGADRGWSGDQHGVREAVSGSNQTQGTAFLSADETGRNVSAGETSLSASGARGGDAFMTSDEMGRDVSEGGGNVASQYPDAAAERAAIEASQQGDDANLARGNTDDFGGKPEITS